MRSLADLLDRIKKCHQIWSPDASQRRVALRLFLMIPLSCHCPPCFHDADAHISDIGELEPYHSSIAGNPDRKYPAYKKKITLESGEVNRKLF